MDILYKCNKCSSVYSNDDFTRLRLWRCPRCGGLLKIIVENKKWELLGTGSITRYSKLSPLLGNTKISLGEGLTPLLARNMSDIRVYLKLEYLNPTGSFKDRGSVVSINHALSLGFKSVAEDSSGNTGLSVAAYATAANLEAKIYVPKDVPEGKKVMIRLFGGHIIECPTRRRAAEFIERDVRATPHTYYIAHTRSPVFIEGMKTVAYELYEKLGSLVQQTAILLPVASGSLLLGLYYGFSDLLELGLIDSLPSLVAVQGASVHPLYRIIYKRTVQGESLLADALRVENPPRLYEMRKAIEETHGTIIVVNDNDIREGLREALRNGFIIEPSSATVFSALRKLVENRYIDRGSKVVLILTGSGLKVVDKIYEAMSI